MRVLTTDHRQPGLDVETEEDVHRELRWYWRDHTFPRMGFPARLRLERDNASTFERHLHEFQPEVLNWWAMGGMSLSLLELGRRAGVPAVAVIGDEWPAYGPHVDGWCRLSLRRPRLAALLERRTGMPISPNYSAVDTWIFNSALTLRSATTTGRPLGQTEVANPGVDAELFRAEQPRPSQWNGRLLYVGRIDARKGIQTAIEALPRLPEATTLTALGRGDERHLSWLRALAQSLGVERRVRFRQVPRRQLPHEYARHDALLFPVRWEEPWGLVPLEGMAMGIPVVASGAGGSAEYLVNEANCLIFRPPDSAGALATAVRRLSAEDHLRRRLCESGRRTAGEFTEERYNEAIRSALERNAVRNPRSERSDGRESRQ